MFCFVSFPFPLSVWLSAADRSGYWSDVELTLNNVCCIVVLRGCETIASCLHQFHYHTATAAAETRIQYPPIAFTVLTLLMLVSEYTLNAAMNRRLYLTRLFTYA